MKFGTSIDMLAMGAPVPTGMVANNVDIFALTSEEAAYVASLDAQRYANKEALETVLKAAQDNYQKQASRIITMRDAFMDHLTAKHKLSADMADEATIENGFFIAVKKSDILSVSSSGAQEDFTADLSVAASSKALEVLLAKCEITEEKDVADLMGYVLSVKPMTASLENNLNKGNCIEIFKGINTFSEIVLNKNTEGKELLKSAFENKDFQIIKIFIMANFSLKNKSDPTNSLKSSVNLMKSILLSLALQYTKK